MAITKINDTTVADVREQRQIYSKTQLVSQKASLEAQLVIVNELLEVFE